MDARQKLNLRDAGIGIVLLAALLVLAVLQYRWIGQVSEADRDRLQRDLRTAVRRFSEDFNTEIERLVQVLTSGPADLEGRAAVWSDVTQHPGILKKVWAADAVDLPAHLRPLAARLPADGFRGGRGGGRPLSVDGSVPALAVPRSRPNPGVDGAPPPWLIIELDRAYIEGTWVPELIARDFGDNYDVTVTSRVGEIPDEAEDAPLFTLRIGPFGRGGRGGGGGPPDKQGKRSPFGRPPGEEGEWRVIATYKSGTMTELVEGLRLRNLAVSFGILLLMGVSVAMLMRSTRRANALARQQMEFVAGVTHELRTPLAVIQSASQNLADGVATGEAQAKRYGGVIHDQSKRLGNMVEQVLRFAGLSSEHGLHKASVEVVPLLEEATADCQATVNLDASQAPAIDGDRGALLHCMRNLLSNATKHGGGDVRVTARPSGAMVEIVVEDSGPGIDAADLPHIFEPFYRGQRAKEEQVQGSGLGLSLVKKIVEGHGGTVEVSSPGGARFRILLPAVKA